MKRTMHNLNELQQFASQVASSLRSGAVLLLSGPLGSGKTTFVQALARALGVQDKVNSPSYTIVGEYDVPSHEAIKKLVHVDLYRLDPTPPDDPAVIDVLEKIHHPDRLTVIEWAERLPVKLLRDYGASGRRIRFDYGRSVDERIVTVES